MCDVAIIITMNACRCLNPYGSDNGSLGTYMEYLMAALEHDFPSFRAEMNTEFDKEDYTLSLSVDPKEQVSPALAVFDNETQSTTGEYYFFENDAAELDTAIAWDYEYYVLPVTMEKLVSTNTATYASYFMATDMQNEIHLTYHGGVLEELDYTVTYSNNVEKGTATVTATSLMEDLPGELTAAFTICDFEELAEEDDAYYYEYVEHIRILEAIKRYYEYGSPFSEASLKTLNEQYGLLLDYLELTLTDKGVELVGLFTAFGDSRMTLSVESKIPDSGALDSISSDKAEKTDCLLVTLLGSDGEAKEIPDGESVTLSITLDKDTDTDNIELYLLTDADAKPVSLEYRIAETDGSVRLVFDTAALGYFAVVYQADTPADEEPDYNPPTGVLLVTAPFIAAAGAMIFRKRR